MSVWRRDTHIVEDDVTPIPLHGRHAPGKEGQLDDQIAGEGVGEGVDHEIQHQFHQGKYSKNDPISAGKIPYFVLFLFSFVMKVFYG